MTFKHNSWGDIQKFSELISGHFSLLRTLDIDVLGESSLHGPDATALLPLFLFGNATDLQEFRLSLYGSSSLNHFAFPTLTSFELYVENVKEFRASRLPDFLETSPMLQTVRMEIAEDILFDDVPRERAVVLPNIESLCLVVSDGESGYNLVTHIPCPIVRHTSLTRKEDIDDLAL